MSRIIGSKSLASQFNALQEAEVGHFLLRVLEKPEELVDHIRKSVVSVPRRCICFTAPLLTCHRVLREAGTVILKIAYGYTAEPHEMDPLIEMAGDAMDKFARAGVPGAFLVDIMPFCKYVPSAVYPRAHLR